MRAAAALVLLGLAAVSCSSAEPLDRGASESPTGVRSPSAGTGISTSPSATPGPRRPVRPHDFEVGTATDAVAHLAGVIGPRHATSPAFARAARWVAEEFRAHGYDVRRQRVAVPGGDSWGVPVVAGSSVNVVATGPGFDARRPHLVVGAHLDTVPQAPGAEDNASGIGVLLAAVEAVAGRRTRLPVMFVAFGAEEPRGPTDADHHYGSRAFVSAMPVAERRAVRGMLSLDRVGVGEVVPVCTAVDGPDPAQTRALAAADRAGVPTTACENRSSDHWSFVRAGLTGVRIGGTSYAGYHSAGDVPAVVDPAQLRRTGRLVLAWLVRD